MDIQQYKDADPAFALDWDTCVQTAADRAVGELQHHKLSGAAGGFELRAVLAVPFPEGTDKDDVLKVFVVAVMAECTRRIELMEKKP